MRKRWGSKGEEEKGLLKNQTTTTALDSKTLTQSAQHSNNHLQTSLKEYIQPWSYLCKLLKYNTYRNIDCVGVVVRTKSCRSRIYKKPLCNKCLWERKERRKRGRNRRKTAIRRTSPCPSIAAVVTAARLTLYAITKHQSINAQEMKDFQRDCLQDC